MNNKNIDLSKLSKKLHATKMEPKLSISLFSSNVLRENLKSMNLNFKPMILTAIAQFLLNYQKWTRN